MGTPTLIPVEGFPTRRKGKPSRYVSAAKKAAEQPGQVFQIPRQYKPGAASVLVSKINRGLPPWDKAKFEARAARSKTNGKLCNVFVQALPPEPVGDSDTLGAGEQ